MRVRRVGYLLAAVAVVAATVLACRHLDIRPLASASPGWVVAAFAINAAAMLLRALAWLGMLRGAMPGERIPPGRVIRATMIGVLGSALVPGRVGEPLRMWLIARRIDRGGALATVTGTVLSQTLLNLAALLLLGALALPGRLAGHGTAATVVTFA
jgi:uncharacterized membrane protein YbhN (UPF0104 family)